MSGPRVTVCRGCCCGTDDPRAAETWLALLRERLGPSAVRTSGCLGPCDHRDVVVVAPSPHQRSRGARPIWLAWMGQSGSLEDLVAWVESGGPGHPLPVGLALQRFHFRRRRAS